MGKAQKRNQRGLTRSLKPSIGQTYSMTKSLLKQAKAKSCVVRLEKTKIHKVNTQDHINR